jgi:hypothetical protein
MKVSQHFKLGLSQPGLEFVDVDLDRDVPLFVDPRAIRLLDSEWAEHGVALVQDFFRYVLSRIAAGEHDDAWRLLGVLREPNETHLGLSRGRPRGHGLGAQSAAEVWKALSESEAVQSGLLEDLEDTILVIPGISNDLISDMTTDIIKRLLIEFTQDSCEFHGIPLTTDVASGPMWNPIRHEWATEFVELPIVAGDKLLLVPKSIVRRRLEYDPEEYFTHVILESLQDVELSANSELVQLLKNGNRRVTKTSLREKYGSGKTVIAELTKQHPELLDRYRARKRGNPKRPLSHAELAEDEGAPGPDWDALLGAVTTIEPGVAGASKYHRAAETLLQALFYPSLVSPDRESVIHEGRKRIDIRFTNASRTGFFWRAKEHHDVPCGYVIVECKNYSEDIANPELDQLAGRFSTTRGRLGILLYRGASDKALCLQRCKDTFHDNRGWILPLDDEDLTALVEHRKSRSESVEFPLLEERFAELVS